ncbi:MAG: prolyl oligopeptidase family serine peptidase [Actinomycetota bacterium]
MLRRAGSVLALCSALGAAAHAQFVEQRYALTAPERQELVAGRERLAASVSQLKAQSARTGVPTAEQIPDAEIYLDAVDRNLRQNLFFAASSVAQARDCLKAGTARVEALKTGKAPWEKQTGYVTLGYRSAVDGSAQPYQVYIPARVRAAAAPNRLDVFLHGRGGTMNELSFVTSTAWAAAYFGLTELPNLSLYPYGRGNNGWRWAGERDLFEALADLNRRFPVDQDQITLRGFSMGGHGTWHNGLQHPGKWAVMSPGAGFTDTRVYKGITEQFPDWQERLLRMYDPVDWAMNGKNLPVLAYCGDADPAFGQHQQMIDRLKQEGAPFKEYIGPKTEHRYEPAVRAAILAEMAPQKRKTDTHEIHFLTYTLRWPDCKWVTVKGLERHWERSEVHARVAHEGSVAVTTRNVSALQLSPPGTIRKLTLDGQDVKVNPKDAPFQVVKSDGKWRSGELKGLRKRHGLQGPIDDALFGPVVAVSGTGTPWSPELQRWSGQELQRFRDGWDEYLRATLPERTDRTLTKADIKDKNLYLFGDPGSNAVLARLLPKLPIRWTRERIVIAGKQFSSADHVPMLVFPNPENPDRYVVIGCGFTFSRADWQGSNAFQYAHLPDYAVVRFDANRYSDDHRANAAVAGFFDEHWRVLRNGGGAVAMKRKEGR